MHDKNGKPVNVGDTVLVEMTVVATYAGAETCQVGLERKVEGEQVISLCCQAKQTEIIKSAQG